MRLHRPQYASALLSFSGALLFKVFDMSTSPFRRHEGSMRHRAPYQRYHVWSDAALKNNRHRQFVHTKDKWPHPTGDYSGAEIAKRAENRRAGARTLDLQPK
jgi:hypothetical protein